MSKYAPQGERSAQVEKAVHAAATATESRTLFVAPRDCTVTGVSITSDAAATGDASNTTNLNVINVGSAGVGTTEVANLDLGAGVNLVALDEKAIPLNTTYANGVTMSEGDVLTIQFEKVGTGVLVGPASFKVTWH